MIWELDCDGDHILGGCTAPECGNDGLVEYWNGGTAETTAGLSWSLSPVPCGTAVPGRVTIFLYFLIFIVISTEGVSPRGRDLFRRKREFAEHLSAVSSCPLTQYLCRSVDSGGTFDDVEEASILDASHPEVGEKDPGGLHECLQGHYTGDQGMLEEFEGLMIVNPEVSLP